jgi:hypothetical protein
VTALTASAGGKLLNPDLPFAVDLRSTTLNRILLRATPEMTEGFTKIESRGSPIGGVSPCELPVLLWLVIAGAFLAVIVGVLQLVRYDPVVALGRGNG